ncbi:MAG: helix-turn-helix domain-containing protein [Myxococcota bacterium]
MKWSEVGTQVCSLARSLSVVGDPWTLLFLREAFTGTTRFEDFLSGTGASRAIATERLGDLVAHGVLERREYLEAPRRYEYLLTPMGRDLLPVILTLVQWGDAWLSDGDPAPARLTHATCGASDGYELRCKSCDEPVGTDVRVDYRPGAWATGRKTTKKRLRPRERDAR